MLKPVVLAFAASAALVVPSVSFAAVTLQTDAASCGTLCMASGTFTQTWSARNFDSTINRVGAVAFDRRLLGDDNLTFRITFQNAAGQTVGDFGAWTLASLPGQVVTLQGSGFDWNAGLGDLTMKVSVVVADSGGVGGGGLGGFVGSGLPGAGAGIVDAVTNNGAHPAVMPRISEDPIAERLEDIRAVVPEPATWAMMILGFGAAGALLRRRRGAAYA